MKKREFVKFFNYMVVNMRASSNRIATVKSILSSLSNYIENILDDEFEDFRNIVTKIEVSVKQPVREKTVLTEEDIERCLKILVEKKKYQQACYFALALASGARKAELLRFKVEYFDDSNIVFGSLYKTPEKIKTKGRSSKGKMLYKYVFVKQFKPYFDLWMKEREELGINSEWLFVVRKQKSGKWEQAEVFNANRWVDTISKLSGLPIYSHSCRHRYVTMMKEAKIPDSVIVEIMGWAKESGGAMVAIYSDMDESETLADYFDENGIRTDIKQGKVTDL